jgi:hypothetical protein
MNAWVASIVFAQHVRDVGNGEFGSDCFSDTDGVCDQKQMGIGALEPGRARGSLHAEQPGGRDERARARQSSMETADGMQMEAGPESAIYMLSARQLCVMQQSNQADSGTTQSDLSHTLWYPFGVRILWVGFQPSPCSDGTRSGCFPDYETHWREKPAPYCADVELLVPFETIVFQVGSRDRP